MNRFITAVLTILVSANCYAATGAKVDGDFNINGNLYLNNSVVLTPSTTILKDRGTYSGQNGYSAGDVVQYNGSSYVAKAATSALPTTSDWTVLAAQGIAGATGPAGPTGPTGPSGASGTASGGACGVSTTSKSNYVLNNWNPAGSMDQNGPVNATSFSQLITFNNYPDGNVLGYNNNYGFQLTASGTVVTYYLQFLPDGYIDGTFPKIPVAVNRWKYITINGNQQALLIDTSPIRYGLGNDVFFTMNGPSLQGGEVMMGPSSPMPQTTQFTTNMLSGKTTSMLIKGSYVTLTFVAGGNLTVIKPDGTSMPGLTWSVVNGQLNVANMLTFTIVGGSSTCWAVTYTDASSSQPTTVIGPVAMVI